MFTYCRVCSLTAECVLLLYADLGPVHKLLDCAQQEDEPTTALVPGLGFGLWGLGVRFRHYRMCSLTAECVLLLLLGFGV